MPNEAQATPAAPQTQLAPHQQRVVDEKTELDQKLTKLKGFFNTEIFATLDTEEQERLNRQEVHMQAYSDVLQERIANF